MIAATKLFFIVGLNEKASEVFCTYEKLLEEIPQKVSQVWKN